MHIYVHVEQNEDVFFSVKDVIICRRDYPGLVELNVSKENVLVKKKETSEKT